jgi:hypothetical protein
MMKLRLTPPPETAQVHHLRTRYYFWSKVDRRGPDECWPWLGSMGGGGTSPRPRLKSYEGKVLNAHRVAWEIHNNEMLGERVARHTCDNPSCVNPHHILPGTRADNVQDAKDRGRYTGMREKMTAPTKLTEDDVAAIRLLADMGETQIGIARHFGVSDRAIRCILKGETWVGKGMLAARSSTVELAAHNGLVAGSTPAARTTEQNGYEK